MATYDWTGTDIIPNGSGSAVRADLNDALLALFSQNSSATEPPETVAYMPWADTSTGLYKVRNAANSGWITLYQLDGEWTTIALENGTAAAPSLYFKDSGTDTGVYSPGTDQVAITTAGVQRVNFNAGTEVVFNDGGADVDFRIEGDTKTKLLWVDAGNDAVGTDGEWRYYDADASNYVAFKAPATVSSNVTWTLPSADGTTEQSLVTDGSGTFSFASRSRLVLSTAVASTSGTSIDFTGIPSWVKRITVMFNGVSTNGTSYITVRVGTSGGVISSGYITGNWSVTTAVASSVTNSSTGFEFIVAGAGSVQQGALVLSQIDTGAWIGQGSFYDNNPTIRMAYVTGRVTGLASALDRIRITTVNGTDTFDAGSINIIYEG